MITFVIFSHRSFLVRLFCTASSPATAWATVASTCTLSSSPKQPIPFGIAALALETVTAIQWQIHVGDDGMIDPEEGENFFRPLKMNPAKNSNLRLYRPPFMPNPAFPGILTPYSPTHLARPLQMQVG